MGIAGRGERVLEFRVPGFEFRVLSSVAATAMEHRAVEFGVSDLESGFHSGDGLGMGCVWVVGKRFLVTVGYCGFPWVTGADWGGGRREA